MKRMEPLRLTPVCDACGAPATIETDTDRPALPPINEAARRLYMKAIDPDWEPVQ